MHRPLDIRGVVVVALALLSPVMLLGCNSIEHRSEAIPKKSLPQIAEDRSDPQLIWTTANGTGAGKTDAKLRLAFGGNNLISADTRGNLRAQDCRTGKIIWDKKTNLNISGGPTVIGNYLLVGTRDKGLLAYRVSDGEFLWQTPLPGEALAAPKGSREMVFVHTLDGSLNALNIKNGQLLWRHNLSSPPIVLRHSSSPAIDQNHVLVGFANGRLVALHRMDGTQSWEREIAIPRGRSDIQRMTDISADPIVHEGIVYVVSYQGKLAALQIDSGNPIWERPMSSYSGFTLSKNTIVVADAKGSLVAIHRRNGKTLWERSDLQGRRLSKPEIWKDKILVGDDEGYLHWVSMNDGSYLNRQLVDNKGIEAAPIVENNNLYVLGRSGKIAVFQLGNTGYKSQSFIQKVKSHFDFTSTAHPAEEKTDNPGV